MFSCSSSLLMSCNFDGWMVLVKKLRVDSNTVYGYSIRYMNLALGNIFTSSFTHPVCQFGAVVTVGIQGILDEFGKGFFKHFQFGIADIIEQQVLICIFLHVFSRTRSYSTCRGIMLAKANSSSCGRSGHRIYVGRLYGISQLMFF